MQAMLGIDVAIIVRLMAARTRKRSPMPGLRIYENAGNRGHIVLVFRLGVVGLLSYLVLMIVM